MEQRLQKMLAAAGIASRRRAEELITAGRVTVNGQVVTAQGTNVDPERDEITVDGEKISVAAKRYYIALNKPVGYVSTVSDPHAEKKVVDLVQIPGVRLVPVGRLDADSEGLLLLSDDGEFVFKVTHPSQSLGKTYVATVRGRPDPDTVDRLARGLKLGDGYVTAPAGAKLLGRGAQAGTNLIELTLHEGRYRQVRRMLDTVGHPVVRLVRIRVGPVMLSTLQPGEWRHLTETELRLISEGKNAPQSEPQEENRRNVRGYYEDGERRPIERNFGNRNAPRPTSRPGGYEDRPGYGGRPGPGSDRPQGGRPAYGGGRPPQGGGDRPQFNGGDRRPQGPPRGSDDRGPRPSFGGGGDRPRPSFGGGGDRGPRPSFGGGNDRGPRPPFNGGDRRPQGPPRDGEARRFSSPPPRRPMGNGDGPRPSFGGGGGRPAFNGGDNNPRPPQGGRPSGDRPSYGGGRPPQGGGDRPSYGGGRPSFGGGRPPQGNGGGRPPQSGGNGPRPPFNGGNRGPQRPFNGGNSGGSRPPYRPQQKPRDIR